MKWRNLEGAPVEPGRIYGIESRWSLGQFPPLAKRELLSLYAFSTSVTPSVYIIVHTAHTYEKFTEKRTHKDTFHQVRSVIQFHSNLSRLYLVSTEERKSLKNTRARITQRRHHFCWNIHTHTYIYVCMYVCMYMYINEEKNNKKKLSGNNGENRKGWGILKWRDQVTTVIGALYFPSPRGACQSRKAEQLEPEKLVWFCAIRTDKMLLKN